MPDEEEEVEVREDSTEGDDEEHEVPTDLLDLHVALEAQEAGML